MPLNHLYILLELSPTLSEEITADGWLSISSNPNITKRGI